MDLRFYEDLPRFNRGMDQALESLDTVEKLELGSAEVVSRVRTNLCELSSSSNKTISAASGGTGRRPRKVPMKFTSN